VRRAVSDAEKEQRREAILAAARSVFAESGFHAATIADVARAASMAYGSVYWYFESKEALFLALMESQEAALRQHIGAAQAVLGAGAGPLPLFRASVRATFEFFESDRAAVRLLFRDSVALGDSFERHLFAIQGRFMADIEATVVAAQSEGLLLEGPPRLIAFSVVGLIGQVAHRRLVVDDGLEPAEAADFVVDLLFQGLLRR
jgi:AcrR family transcriptional regulator